MNFSELTNFPKVKTSKQTNKQNLVKLEISYILD